MRYLVNSVDPIIIHEIFNRIYKKLYVGSIKCLEENNDDNLIKRTLFIYEYHRIEIVLTNNFHIVMRNFAEKITCLFKIDDPIDDDAFRLIILNSANEISVAHINLCDMDRAIIEIMYGNNISRSMAYKNKPKMLGSRYGSQLHDINIVCIDE